MTRLCHCDNSCRLRRIIFLFIIVSSCNWMSWCHSSNSGSSSDWIHRFSSLSSSSPSNFDHSTGHSSSNSNDGCVDGSSDECSKYFCGEIDSPKKYMIDASAGVVGSSGSNQNVEIVVSIDKFDERTNYQFSIMTESSAEFHQRNMFSSMPSNSNPFYHLMHSSSNSVLSWRRQGTHVEGTRCDRIFDNCLSGHPCYLTSPGFPEIYPRNLRCRYLIESKISSTHNHRNGNSKSNTHNNKHLVTVETMTFDVDGHECSIFSNSISMCFPKPIRSIQKILPSNVLERPLSDDDDGDGCKFDYVRFYDGHIEDDAPLITTMCGWGRLSTPIVSSSSILSIEFVTSPAGYLINNGFQLKIEPIEQNSQSLTSDAMPIEYNPIDGSCIISKVLTEVNSSNLFTSLKSWYPPNTTCIYRFSIPPMAGHVGHVPQQDRILIQFLWFKIERITMCEESIRIYDGGEIDPNRLINKLCDTNKPMGGSSKSNYVSSGPVLLIQFSSTIGSLSGSTINYGIDVKRITVTTTTTSNGSGHEVVVPPSTLESMSTIVSLGGIVGGHDVIDHRRDRSDVHDDTISNNCTMTSTP